MITPNKLKPGDEVRIIAPSMSQYIISEECLELATKRFEDMGLKVSFGEHVNECDLFQSSPVESRVADLHDAFSDPTVKAIITVIGGFNCNQLLKYIDYDLIAKNPKIFCGFSDITALQNAILAKTGLVTYSGPHFSTFGMVKGFEYVEEYFKKNLFSNESFTIEPSEKWSDDPWFMDQENRVFIDNPGYTVWNEGEAEGHIVGGNLPTLCLLNGTEYMPNLEGAVLFLEDDDFAGEDTDVEIDRNLQSLIHQASFNGVKAIVFGRFQNSSMMADEVFEALLTSKRELANIPIISGADFGHTTPLATFPIGGKVKMVAKEDAPRIEIC